MNAKKKKQLAEENEERIAVAEIENIQNRLDEAYAFFNRTTDTDVMDACVFEISALRSRYNTAIKHYRDRYS